MKPGPHRGVFCLPQQWDIYILLLLKIKCNLLLLKSYFESLIVEAQYVRKWLAFFPVSILDILPYILL